MRLPILMAAAFLAGCASFYSNVDLSELPEYEASFYRQGNTLFVEIKNVAGLNITDIDHRIIGDALVLFAHRISSGPPSKREFQIAIPDSISRIYWLSRD